MHTTQLPLYALNRLRLASLFLILGLLLSLWPLVVSQPVQAATKSQTSSQVTLIQHGTRLRATDSQKTLTLAISLKPPNQAALDQFLQALYNPTSPLYHQYLTPEEFTNRFMDSATRSEVLKFLQNQGLKVKDSGLGSTLSATGTVGQIQKALGVQISDYADTNGRVFYANDLTPALPSALAPDIQVIAGLDDYNQLKPIARNIADQQAILVGKETVGPRAPAGCAAGIAYANSSGDYVPNQLAGGYNFGDLYSQSITGTGQSVALFELTDYPDSDVSFFENCFGSTVPVIRKIVDGPQPIIYLAEVNLDIDVIAGLAPGLSQLLVYENPNTNVGLLNEYQQIASDNLARTVSSSYGACEPSMLPNSILAAENTIFQQMAVQGQSMFAASGDSGSADCQPYNSNPAVDDPSSQPYVTGVGGTALTVNNTDNSWQSETAWGGSGGGLSAFWPKPAYQLSSNLTTTNSNGMRQVPDVAANAAGTHRYVVAYNGNFTSVNGTSGAAPLWAAGAALTTQYLLAHGAAPLGFANAAIYNLFGVNPAAFHDITVGGNGAYNAAPGYDLVTGVGSLNLGQFATGVLNNAATPYLAAQTAPVIYRADIGGSDPDAPAPTLMAINKTINFSTSISFSANSGTHSWLTVNANPGSVTPAMPLYLSLNVTSGSLAVGIYTATLTFVDNLNPNDKASIKVVFSLRDTNKVSHAACNEASLDAALLVGGRIAFDCASGPYPANPVTINLTTQKVPQNGTILDGSVCNQNVILSGDPAMSVGLFYVDDRVTFTLKNLTVTNGRDTFGNGGALTNFGNLNVINSTLSNNTSQLPAGTGTATGGALYVVTGTVNIVASTIATNTGTVIGSGGAANGGGLYISSGNVTITNSTLGYNAATNSAANGGGGIYLAGGTLNLFNSTLVSNTVGGGTGGGISVTGGAAHLVNTIVADNTAATGPDISGTFASQGHNLVGNSSGASGFVASDITNSNPLLNPLAYNGGYNQTFLPQAASPVLNAGNDLVCSSAPVSGIDQRGFARPAFTHCDIGAVERQAGFPAYSYYLPYLANNANGYTSQLIIQNVNELAANISSQFYDEQGQLIQVQINACSKLAAHASCQSANPFNNQAHGTGVLRSDQPLKVLVVENTPDGGSAYAVEAGASASLAAPLAINNQLGFNTSLTIANVADAPANATITFYDQLGIVLPSATKNLNLPAHTAQTLDQTAQQSGLPMGFYGWAKIDGTAGAQLVGQVLEQRPDIKFLALANAQNIYQSSVSTPQNQKRVASTGNYVLYAPAIFREAFGSFMTGANIINPAATPVSVTITYYDSQGKAYPTAAFGLSAHALTTIYHGANQGDGLPTGGLPQNFYGSAVIESSGNVIMVVNEAGGQTKNGAAQNGTYAASYNTANSSKAMNNIGLPVIAKNGNGLVTGATILNTSDKTVNVTIAYYNPAGTLAASPDYFQIAAHASQPLYQGNATDLPDGFVGQALITGDVGNLVVTTNAQNDDLFYTYTEAATSNGQ